MKRRIFWYLFFYCFFLRLQIYEAIAAVFWQSASFVLRMSVPRLSSNLLAFITEFKFFSDHLYFARLYLPQCQSRCPLVSRYSLLAFFVCYLQTLILNTPILEKASTKVPIVFILEFCGK